MPNRTSTKGRPKKATTKRKVLDLPVKTVKGGDAGSIKGGTFIKYNYDKV